MTDSSENILVFMTAGSGEEAARLAEMLVASHLAACVQILPQIESIYRWQGNIERQAEVMLIAKTEMTRFDELEREVRALHTYDTPEIVAVPIATASAAYLKWLADSLLLSSDEQEQTPLRQPAAAG